MPGAARTVGVTNLPALITSFVEAPGSVDVVRALVLGCRLVTLTGPGGVGKTRLVIEVGTRCLDDYDDGVCMVELAPVVEPDSVVGAIAAALGVTPQAGATTLRSRSSTRVGAVACGPSSTTASTSSTQQARRWRRSHPVAPP